jgi:two-component system, chemotaxis family, chemotaxis protein CheY
MSYSVLLCDDALFMRTMLRGIVTAAGYEVLGEAENGKRAVELYRDVRPDIVVMDMVMPELSGVDAVRDIRRLDPGARIVMCSAMGQQQLVADALSAGASGFITKPFTASRVLEALVDLMQGAAA